MKKGQRNCLTSPDRQRRNCCKNQGKPGGGRPWTNSFRLAWIELRGPEGHRSTCIRNRETPAGFKPNPPKPSVEKLPDVAFWRPKERWRKANRSNASLGLNLGAPRGTVQHASETAKPQQDSSPTRQNHPSKNCLTLLSDALKKDEVKKGQRNCLTSPDRQRRNCCKNQRKPGGGRPWTNRYRLAWIELRGPEGHRSTCIRNSETPAGFKPKPAKTIRRKTAWRCFLTP